MQIWWRWTIAMFKVRKRILMKYFMTPINWILGVLCQYREAQQWPSPLFDASVGGIIPRSAMYIVLHSGSSCYTGSPLTFCPASLPPWKQVHILQILSAQIIICMLNKSLTGTGLPQTVHTPCKQTHCLIGTRTGYSREIWTGKQ